MVVDCPGNYFLCWICGFLSHHLNVLTKMPEYVKKHKIEKKTPQNGMLEVSDTSKEKGRSSPKKALRRRESNNFCCALTPRQRSLAARPLACYQHPPAYLLAILPVFWLAHSRLPRGVTLFGHGVKPSSHHITSQRVSSMCAFREWCGVELLLFTLTKMNDETVHKKWGSNCSSHVRSNMFTASATKWSFQQVWTNRTVSSRRHPGPICSSGRQGVCACRNVSPARARQELHAPLPLSPPDCHHAVCATGEIRLSTHLEGHVSPSFPSARVPDSRDEACLPGGVCCVRHGLRHHMYVVDVESPSSQQEVFAAEATRQPRPCRRARFLGERHCCHRHWLFLWASLFLEVHISAGFLSLYWRKPCSLGVLAAFMWCVSGFILQKNWLRLFFGVLLLWHCDWVRHHSFDLRRGLVEIYCLPLQRGAARAEHAEPLPRHVPYQLGRACACTLTLTPFSVHFPLR